MLLKLLVPVTNADLGPARIGHVHPAIGDALQPGSPLVDVIVGQDTMAFDCPPISKYRVTSRETAWLRRIDMAQGQFAHTGASIALLSTSPDEPLENDGERAVRVSVAAIIAGPGW